MHYLSGFAQAFHFLKSQPVAAWQVFMQSVNSGAALLVPWRDDARVMALVGLGHAGSHFSHLLLPLMFPVFIQEFGWRYAELGMLSTLFFVVSGTGQAAAHGHRDR